QNDQPGLSSMDYRVGCQTFSHPAIQSSDQHPLRSRMLTNTEIGHQRNAFPPTPITKRRIPIREELTNSCFCLVQSPSNGAGGVPTPIPKENQNEGRTRMDSDVLSCQ